MDCYSVTKKNEIMPFAVTRMQLEMIILSKSERERQISYDIIYMWNLKYDTNEPINQPETASWIQKTDLWLPGERGLGEGWSGRWG